MVRLTTLALLGLALTVSPANVRSGAAKASALGTPVAARPMAVVLETTQGTIVIRLAPEAAPKTCANFRKLVARGFYDSTCFHRVIPGFMIQGGDPNSKDSNPFNDGQGGPGYTVPGEIKLLHVRGAVATARLADSANPARESSGSQFFIDVADRKDLDRGGYTVFGHVISGMEAVDRIVALANDPGIARTAMGANPGRKSMIRKAHLEPLSKWEKTPAAAAAESTPH